MKPYYDEDGITIYHGDCADVLPTLDPADVDLVLTDPPYGIGYVSPKGLTVHGDEGPFDPRPLLRFGRCVIFGANYFAHLLPPGGWIVWSKRQDNRNFTNFGTGSTGEVAWSNCLNTVQVFNYFWGGGPWLRAPEERGNTRHPTLKPVSLMRWILDRWTEPGDLILDPYMGSGPVAQACHELGRRYIGVEIVEDYCRIAVDRLRQGVLALEATSVHPHSLPIPQL